MDKAKFQTTLSQSLKNICVVHCTLNCAARGFIPSVFGNSSMLDFDILMIEQTADQEILEIKVEFRDVNNPWATIDIKGRNIGVGFYACEDPIDFVWEKRVYADLKAELINLNVAKGVQDAIKAICNAYQAAK